MNINALPIALPEEANSITVGTAVLAKNLDTIEQVGDSLIKMMEQSVNPNLGKHIDIRV